MTAYRGRGLAQYIAIAVSRVYPIDKDCPLKRPRSRSRRLLRAQHDAAIFSSARTS
jgi:hypothetical protein